MQPALVVVQHGTCTNRSAAAGAARLVPDQSEAWLPQAQADVGTGVVQSEKMAHQ